LEAHLGKSGINYEFNIERIESVEHVRDLRGSAFCGLLLVCSSLCKEKCVRIKRNRFSNQQNLLMDFTRSRPGQFQYREEPFEAGGC
jgi:hypothetical protein